MTRNWIISLAVACCLAAGAIACSEVTESPEDCSSDEFFDRASQFCRVCPALEVPECPVGCGVLVGEDLSGCATAECQCDVCSDGQYYDRESLSCAVCPPVSEGSCGEGCVPVGTTLDDDGCAHVACACDAPCSTGGACGECPATDCGDPVCGCEAGFTGVSGDDGCAVFECACPAEIPDTHEIDETGACRLREG